MSDSSQASDRVLGNHPTGWSRTSEQGWYQEEMEADNKEEPQACPEHSSEAVGHLMIEQGF